jgi:hypothetical protein
VIASVVGPIAPIAVLVRCANGALPVVLASVVARVAVRTLIDVLHTPRVVDAEEHVPAGGALRERLHLAEIGVEAGQQQPVDHVVHRAMTSSARCPAHGPKSRSASRGSVVSGTFPWRLNGSAVCTARSSGLEMIATGCV